MGQYKGYLWNKVEEPKLIFKESELRKVYNKQNKEYYLEYLLFPNKLTYERSLNNDTNITTENEFYELARKCLIHSVKCIKAKLVYPFGYLEQAKDKIIKLKQGDILITKFINGQVLVLHIKSIVKVTQNKYSLEKEKIKKELKRIKEKQLITDKQYSIFNMADIKINENICNILLKEMVDTFPLIVPKQILPDTVLEFQFYGQPKVFLVSDFLDYYNNNPIMNVIKRKETLLELFNRIIEEKYLLEEGIKLGVTNDKRFILDKKDYLNRLILNEYFQKFFFISDVDYQDICEYYNANLQKFTKSEICYVSEFTFKNTQTALISLSTLVRLATQNGIQTQSDTTGIGLLSSKPNVIINTSSKYYPIPIINKIYFANKYTPIGPFKINNQIKVLIKTNEQGQETQPLELVKETIKGQIISEKIDTLKYIKLQELKKKYPIIINKIIE